MHVENGIKSAQLHFFLNVYFSEEEEEEEGKKNPILPLVDLRK